MLCCLCKHNQYKLLKMGWWSKFKSSKSNNLMSDRFAKIDTVPLISLLYPRRSHDHAIHFRIFLVLSKRILTAFILFCALYIIFIKCSLRGHYANPFLFILSDALSDNELSDIECFDCKPEIHLQCQRYINTRRYQASCMSPPSSLYPVLITGLGGCGSHHIAQRLDRMGLQLPHEELGEDGSVVRLS